MYSHESGLDGGSDHSYVYGDDYRSSYGGVYDHAHGQDLTVTVMVTPAYDG